VTIENSWSYRNGWNVWEDTDFQGNGDGFKLGRQGGAHVVRNSMAWINAANGFDTNHNTAGVQIVNSVAYGNDRNWVIDDRARHVIRNNISIVSNQPDIVGELADEISNIWNGEHITLSDFMSVDFMPSQDDRSPSGELPSSDFLKLNPSSLLIDAGTIVGLPYRGTAPDLGAVESGLGGFVNAGDFDGDGDVDGADFVVWQTHFPANFGSGWEDGDADLDGDVDGADFVAWQTSNLPAAGGTTIIPEPSALTLGSWASLIGLLLRYTRRKVR
jgi:hypothetical protein